MRCGFGSRNPAKQQAVEEALADISQKTGQEFTITSVEVESGVSAQPLSEEETRAGAYNRARAVLDADPALELGIGLEGGVSFQEDGVYSTVWIVVIKREGKEVAVNGARFALPEFLAQALRNGEEMGPTLDAHLGTEKINHKEGMIGWITGGVVTRAEAYSHLVKLAMSIALNEKSYNADS